MCEARSLRGAAGKRGIALAARAKGEDQGGAPGGNGKPATTAAARDGQPARSGFRISRQAVGYSADSHGDRGWHPPVSPQYPL